MKATNEKQILLQRLLQRNNIQIQSVKGFSFMKRYCLAPDKENMPSKTLYGQGILTLHLEGGTDKAICLSSSKQSEVIVRYLLSRKIPFINYIHRNRTAETIPYQKFCRPSLYMFYFIILFLTFSILGYNMITTVVGWKIALGVLAFTLSGFLLYALLFRFCYLSIDDENLTVDSLGKVVKYPYSRLRKINFDYARERVFTHVMEILDEDYNYHLYYIGKVPRTKLEEITRYLQQAGIDATCSLDQDKRYYQDNYKKH